MELERIKLTEISLRQIPYEFIYMCNLQIIRSEQTKQNQYHVQRTEWWF